MFNFREKSHNLLIINEMEWIKRKLSGDAANFLIFGAAIKMMLQINRD